MTQTWKIYMNSWGYDGDWESHGLRRFQVADPNLKIFTIHVHMVGLLQAQISMKNVTRRPFTLAITTILAVVFFAAYAQAQEGLGLRAGVSADPSQFYFGGHAAFGPVVDKLWFRPNLEVGVGNNVTLIALNGEFVYWTPIRKNPWNVYLGGGPAANIFTSGGAGNRNSDVRPGFNFLVGIAQRTGLFSEIKIGAIDSPSFKFGIGYTFPTPR